MSLIGQGGVWCVVYRQWVRGKEGILGGGYSMSKDQSYERIFF